MQLYASGVALDLDRPADGHWSRWTRSQIILEVYLRRLDVHNTLGPRTTQFRFQRARCVTFP